MIVVYTAHAGERDFIRPAKRIDGRITYAVFTDDTATGDYDEILNLRDFSDDPTYMKRRTAKAPKVLSHLYFPRAEMTVWCDSNRYCCATAQQLEDAVGDAEIGLFRHESTTCAYHEAKDCYGRHDYQERLEAQTAHYRLSKFPKNYGLYNGYFIIRRNTPAVQAFELAWWEQICRFSSRDQISMPYALWRTRPKVAILKNHEPQLMGVYT